METVSYTNGEHVIRFHVLRTEEGAAERDEVFKALFSPEGMERQTGLAVGDVSAVLYQNEVTAYLCWTHSPEYSFALEFVPGTVPLSDILRMAESIK